MDDSREETVKTVKVGSRDETTAISRVSKAPVTRYIPSTPRRPTRPDHTLRYLLAHSNGREKVIRAIQYTLRLYIYLSTPSTRRRFPDLLFLVSLLSLTRKANTLYQTILALSRPAKPRVQTLTSLLILILTYLNALADDAYFLLLAYPGRSSKVERWQRKADFYSDATWLSLSLTKLYAADAKLQMNEKKSKAIRRILIEVETDTLIKGEEGLEKGRKCKADLAALKKEESRYWWLRVQHSCDAIFAAYDVLEIRRGSESVRAVTGFLSAALGLHQAWSA